MRLKKMEIYGFKSFAQKTKIEFGQGITAVVGPNGSGKSNISDAIRWALGEQSAKQLRGNKMEDIIFNGTSEQKPLNMSEVALFFDNHDGLLPLDYNEVVIKRRIYRSGESDYFINNTSCRLKDIYDVFMGTGVGRETYATIEQGKIDLLTSTKPEDRRIVFEEAAGILKHKYKKKEALHKLEEIKQKILRLEDLLQEINHQLVPLAEQKEKATRFQSYQTMLYDLEQTLALDIWQRLLTEKEKLTELAVIHQAEQQKEEAAECLLQEKLQQIELSSEQQEIDFTHCLVTIQELAGKLDFLEQTITNNLQRKIEIEARRKVYQQKREALQQTINQEKECVKISAEKEKQLAELLSSYQVEEGQLTESLQEKEVFIQQAEATLDALKGDLIDLLNRKAKKQYELKQLEENKKAFERKAVLLAEQKEKLQQQLAVYENKEEAWQVSRNATQKEIAERNIRKIQLAQQAEEMKATAEAEKKKLYQVEKQLTQEKSRYHLLQELERSMEGYHKGVKSIMQSNLTDQYCGTVAQLMAVEQRYERAIEVALGNAVQNLITPTEKNAQALIAYLKETHGGRATFLPLNRIHQEKRTVPDLPGLLGIAADLIGYDPKYQAVMLHLLGRVLISDDLTNALAIAKRLDQRWKIITLEGDMISPGGAMTGGSFTAKQSGILSRKRELAELAASILVLEEKQKQQRTFVEQQEARLRELEIGQERNRDGLLRLEFVAKQLEQDQKELEQQRRAWQEESELLHWENKQLLLDADKQAEREQQEQQGFLQLEQEEQRNRQRIVAHQEQLLLDKAALTQGQECAWKNKLEVASLLKERDHLLALQERSQKSITEMQAEQQVVQNQIEQEMEQLQLLKREEEKCQQAGRDYLEKQASEKQRQVLLEQVKQDLLVQKSQLLGQTELQKKSRQEREKTTVKLVAEQAKILSEMQHQQSWLEENYQMKKPYPIIKLEPDARREKEQQAEQYRQQIASLGLVNLAAIAEHSVLKKRYHFLQEQYQDLTAGRASLYKLLKELDEVMEKNFTATFLAIKEKFQQIFTRLFEGGKAELFLTDPTQVLVAGVEIMVQPPGKKLQNLSLLSGGEKSLTAVALLFSILQVKPSPFCLLDEIDAAFDDSNVKRVADLLKEMAETMQFILITHRKGAMEAADVLYGITMERAGISRLISVKLEAS